MLDMLTTDELAHRWKIAPKTLRNWRVKKIGPAYFKGGIGRYRVLYPLDEIERFESERLQFQSTLR